MFIYENLNPSFLASTDCVIRAIAKAENKTWLEVFDTLVELARKNYTMINDQASYSKYLDSKYTRIIPKLISEKKKVYTVNQISEWDGTYIILVKEHLTVVVNHDIYDTWDCGNKHAIMIWKVKG